MTQNESGVAEIAGAVVDGMVGTAAGVGGSFVAVSVAGTEAAKVSLGLLRV